MGLRINTNVASINAQRNLGKTRNDQQKSLEKLSSGFRINRAGDDAAGLAISEALKAQIKGLRQAKRNSEDGISLVQVAEGALNEIGSIMIRMRETAVQAASDTIGPVERQFIQTEFLQLSSEVNRIAEGTMFNSTHLLNGKGQLFDIQVGTRNVSFIDRISFDSSRINATPEALRLNLCGMATKEAAQQSLAIFDDAIISVSAMRADLGAIQNRLSSTIANIEISLENMSAANSRIRDVDIAEETAELARTNILLQAGTAVLSQANQSTGIALSLLGMQG
jgi:flagellin